MLKGAKRERIFYSFLKWVSVVSLIATLIALICVMVFVLKDGLKNLSMQLLFGDAKDGDTILPAIIGTIRLVAISILIAVPTGVFTAVFLVEYMRGKGKLVRIIRLATETLAGIPSIVYGLFGYLIFVVSFKWGYTMWGGGITLAIMVLPTIVRSTEESLLAVPDGYREGSYALGTNKFKTIFSVILPSASSGIVTSVILAIGRVISESAVLILTIGMVVDKIPASLSGPGTSLALDIYYFYNYGKMEAATATAVVLLLFVLLLNMTATLIGTFIKKKYGGNNE